MFCHVLYVFVYISLNNQYLSLLKYTIILQNYNVFLYNKFSCFCVAVFTASKVHEVASKRTRCDGRKEKDVYEKHYFQRAVAQDCFRLDASVGSHLNSFKKTGSFICRFFIFIPSTITTKQLNIFTDVCWFSIFKCYFVKKYIFP